MGKSPWTFFAFPTSLASLDGLPPDRTACRILAKIQDRIPVAIWQQESNPETTYFACRYEDRFSLDDILHELQELGVMDEGYLAQRCEELFAEAEKDSIENARRKKP